RSGPYQPIAGYPESGLIARRLLPRLFPLGAEQEIPVARRLCSTVGGGAAACRRTSLSEGATSDRPRFISFFRQRHPRGLSLRHACHPIKAERPITRAAQQVLYPNSVAITHVVFDLLSTPGTRGNSACRPESVVRLIVVRVEIGPSSFPSSVHAARSSLVQDSSMRLASFSTAVRTYSTSCRT